MSASNERSGLLDRSDGRSIFGTDAAGYHEARSGYPPALFEDLASRVKQSPAILEIGAGTGLATFDLLKLEPSRLTIIEPDAELCRFLESRFDDQPVTVSRGVFPEVSIEGQFDLVACAAAFHWMEPEAALAKIRSALAPGGTWAMWWNCYFGNGEPSPFADQAQQLLEEEGVALPPSYSGGKHYALDRNLHVDRLEKAGFRNIEHRVYRTTRTLSAQDARGLFDTFSFIRLLEQGVRERILSRITSLVEREFGGAAQSTVVSSIYIASAD